MALQEDFSRAASVSQHACSKHHHLCVLSWHFHICKARKYSSYFCFHLTCWFFFYISEKTLVTEVVAQNQDVHFLWSDKWPIHNRAGLRINTGTKVWMRWPLWFLSVLTDNGNTKTPVSEYYVVTSSLFTKGHCPSSVSSTNQLVA